MFSTLLFVALVSVIAYFATYKLNRRLRVAIALGTFTLLGALPIVFVLLNQDRVACWAYSDQCAADRVLGLSSADRSEEHTSELQSLMRISYAVFCLKTKKRKK